MLTSPKADAVNVYSAITGQLLAYFSGAADSQVVEIKQAVHAQTGIPVQGQKSMFDGNVLENSWSLSDASVPMPGEVLLVAQDPLLEILPVLDAPDAEVRREAVDALGGLRGNADAVTALVMVLNDGSAQVRHAAINALGILAEFRESAGDAQQALVAAITGECWQPPEIHAAELLGYALLNPKNSRDPYARPGFRCGLVPRFRIAEDLKIAIVTLSTRKQQFQIADNITKVLVALSGQVRHKLGYIRIAAVSGLGCLGANGERRASLALVSSLKGGYSDARTAAAVELGELGTLAPAEAVPALTAVLRQYGSRSLWSTVSNVLKRFASMGEERAVAALVSVTSDELLPEDARKIAAERLRELDELAKSAKSHISRDIS